MSQSKIEIHLAGQTALVTGAGRGIGRAISLALGSCGAHVILAARSEHQLTETAQAVHSAGGTVTVVATDLAQEEEILSLFENVQDKNRLDILINNAGLGLFGPVADFSTHDLDLVIQTNLRGTFLCCREAMKLMIRRKAGYIINISSVVGFKGYPN